MTDPIDHHYVPQHFLRAWSIPDDKARLFRFRRIPGIDKFECKKVSIKNSTYQENLYRIELPDGSFEIESSVITPELDEPGHKAIDLIRTNALSNLARDEQRELAIYLVGLEGRHPDTLKKMDVREALPAMREAHKRENKFNHDLVDDVFNYFSKSSVNVMALRASIKNERNGYMDTPFSNGLLNANVVELQCDCDVLITSDFPCFRWGHLHKHFLYVVAVSPRKALIYSPDNDVLVFKHLPVAVAARAINLYTLAFAERAFDRSLTQRNFVERHLGWARNIGDSNDAKEYVNKFLLKELNEAGIT